MSTADPPPINGECGMVSILRRTHASDRPNLSRPHVLRRSPYLVHLNAVAFAQERPSPFPWYRRREDKSTIRLHCMPDENTVSRLKDMKSDLRGGDDEVATGEGEYTRCTWLD